MSLWVDEVIGDFVMMMVTVKIHNNDNIKIVQDEEPREEESRTPERIRDPGVKVVVIPWRRVIGYHWRAFLVIIVVYDC